MVKRLESAFAEVCEVPHAIAVTSGTTALVAALQALEIGPGDEVITSPFTFVATINAVLEAGATARFADIDPITYTTTPEEVTQRLSDRTRAVLPVHLYGHPADMDGAAALAADHGLKLVEDACQAHGARLNGRRTGSLGEFAAFSFYPAKNLGAYGDAGMLTTNDAELASRVRMMRNYGQRHKYEHVTMAWNRRLDTIQAAVLRVKLRHLDTWNAARRRHAALYNLLLEGCGLTLPKTGPGVEHVFHQYVVQVPGREKLVTELAERGVATGMHYPVPIHLQEAYRGRGMRPGSFPVTEQAAARLLSLPMYPELRPDQVERVAEEIRSLVAV